MLCWSAGSLIPSSWLSASLVGNHPGVLSGVGAGADHRDVADELSSVSGLAGCGTGVLVDVVTYFPRNHPHS